MKTSLALIGFMGTGKTAVGKALAIKLGREFIELDSLIEQLAGKIIPDIFQQDGEIIFRELEIAAIRQVASKEGVVIACGGGVVLNQINIDRLRNKSVIIYLTASPKVILKRVSEDSTERPLLEVANPALTIQKLLEFRQPFYERAADITIDTSTLDINSVAKQIIARITKSESAN